SPTMKTAPIAAYRTPCMSPPAPWPSGIRSALACSLSVSSGAPRRGPPRPPDERSRWIGHRGCNHSFLVVAAIGIYVRLILDDPERSPDSPRLRIPTPAGQ